MEPGARKPGSSALRIGVIGAGRIGSFHVRTLVSLPGVASVTVCDADGARARRLAGELGLEVAATPDELVAAGVDALVIATPTPTHVPMIQLAAGAGLPAFCEKPVALELAALDDRDRRRRAQRASSCRSASSGDSTPATAQLREAVSSGAARPPADRPGGDARSHSAGRVVHRGLRRHLPRPPHPRLRRAALRHGRGDRRGLRRRRRARNAVVRRPRRRRRGRRRAQAQRRCACHPVRDAARSARLRRPARALRNQRQRCRRRRCPQPAPLTRGGRGATGLTPLRRLHAAISTRPTRTSSRRSWRRCSDGGPSACTLHEARAALLVALAADRSRIERRPVAVDEVASTPVPAG